jgi:Domain of unknown function (DUF4136)
MRNWIVVVALLVAPAPAFTQNANVDSDRTAAFARYRTYAWTAGTPAANPLAENRIHAAVAGQLAVHGFTLAATPDVFVATMVVTHEQKEPVANGFSGGLMVGGSATASVPTYEIGTLIVDLYDARTKQLVWRGTGTDTLSDKPAKNTAKMNKAVAKMFEQYPPTQK